MYLITDPQTSGGLLIALPDTEAKELVRQLHEQNIVGEIIGEVIQKQEKDLIIE